MLKVQLNSSTETMTEALLVLEIAIGSDTIAEVAIQEAMKGHYLTDREIEHLINDAFRNIGSPIEVATKFKISYTLTIS